MMRENGTGPGPVIAHPSAVDRGGAGGLLGGEEIMAHEALRLGHVMLYRATDLAFISQDVSFHVSDVAKSLCRRLVANTFLEERERFESRSTWFGHCFRREEVGMDLEALEASYVCFLAPMLPHSASIDGASATAASAVSCSPGSLFGTVKCTEQASVRQMTAWIGSVAIGAFICFLPIVPNEG
ncbi:hypothetical protein [Salinicola avicenniae]|uniref:hypothetical protein n=1 Tax=Salinicola avicenniae TaxID=2916836 RepID=UPI00207319A0|nr:MULTISPECIES: hypothetical protein [unclassified Salinicola]